MARNLGALIVWLLVFSCTCFCVVFGLALPLIIAAVLAWSVLAFIWKGIRWLVT